jgi:hypothetical protein
MTDPAYVLRVPPSGQVVQGTPGNVLTLQADGRTVRGAPVPAAVVPVVSNASNGLAPQITAALAVLRSNGAANAAAWVALNSDNVANATVLTGTSVSDVLVALQAQFDAGPQLFHATYYVDPTPSTRSQTGSQSNPFRSIAAAFAAAAAQAIVSGEVILAPATTTIEDVVFPVAGTWEVKSDVQWGYAVATVQGNVDVTCTSTARRALTNLAVTGNVTGNGAAGATRMRFTNCGVSGNVALTGVWTTAFVGGSPTGNNGLGGFVGGTCSTPAVTVHSFYYFVGAVTFAGALHSWGSYYTGDFFSTGGVGNYARFYGTYFFKVGITFTASSGTLAVLPDGESTTVLLQNGFLVSANVVVQSINGQNAVRPTQSNNVASTALAGRFPEGLMVCEATLTLLVAGTVGSAVLNVIYTDLSGALQTKAVTTALNIAGAAGDEVRGTFPFSQNGATAVAYSVTGIVTPGALSYKIGVAVRQAS